MTINPGWAAISLIAPAFAAAMLFLRFPLSQDRVVNLLGSWVAFEALLLLPVHVLAACQIVGLTQAVTVMMIGIFDLVVLAGVGLIAGLSAAWDRPIFYSPQESKPLPRVVVIAGSILLASYFAFAVDLFSSYPSGWDGLVYHLPLSLRWLQAGTLAIPASRVWQFSMPGNTEIAMMLLLATGKQSLAPVINCLALLALTIAVYLIARQCSRDRIASLVAVSILLTVPLFQFQAFSSYVDLHGTAAVMAGIALFLHRYRAVRGGDRIAISWPTVVLAGIACGIAVGTKAVFYVYAAVFFMTAVGTLWKERTRHGKSLQFVVVILALSAAIPSTFWFWRAVHFTGNPVYPLQVSVAGHALFRGYSSTAITAADIAGMHASSVSQWLAYPWTEKKPKNMQGFLLMTYGVDSGLGGAFAAFVPIGVSFCICVLVKRRGNHVLYVLLIAWLVMLFVWWFALRHYLRFGMPLWAMGCALSAPLLATFHKSNSRSFKWLLGGALLATCTITSFTPAHDLLSRVRNRNWTRSGFYEYPEIIDRLAPGSRVLNTAEPFNFPLAGRRLSNYVIPEFELAANLDAATPAGVQADYVVQSSEEQQRFVDLSSMRGKVVFDESLRVSDTGKRIRWRVWHISSATKCEGTQ
jgi:hypothetical protein